MLNFRFPGHPDIDLIENGIDMPVTISNLDKYCESLFKCIMNETIISNI